MLTHLISKVKERTSVLNRFLLLCNACDEATANTSGTLHQELAARAVLGTTLTEERVFRHCATITQLYAIYEAFTEGALNFWLTRLPRYQSFIDLPLSFRNAYRCGIARIIQSSDKRKYRHVSLDDVVGK